MGMKIIAAQVIMVNETSLAVASHIVKLTLGSSEDGMTNGNIAAPQVKIMAAIATELNKKAKPERFQRLDIKTKSGIDNPNTGNNIVTGYLS